MVNLILRSPDALGYTLVDEENAMLIEEYLSNVLFSIKPGVMNEKVEIMYNRSRYLNGKINASCCEIGCCKGICIC